MGVFLLGGVYSAQFGMAAVYGSAAGFTASQIPIFVAAIYTGALLFQYPIGWISDRMDRRRLIMLVSIVGGVVSLVGIMIGANFTSPLMASPSSSAGCRTRSTG